MQHSLILAFVSLGEHNYETSIQTVVDFLHFHYGHQVAYVDAITELCLKINDDGNCSVVTLPSLSMSSNSYALAAFFKKTPISSPRPWTNSPSGCL